MIKPINNHILIDPVKHESFMFNERQTYDEVGTIVDYDMNIGDGIPPGFKVGDKVFFDSWLAAKFPKEDTDEFYWLVPFGSIKAYESLPAQ